MAAKRMSVVLVCAFVALVCSTITYGQPISAKATQEPQKLVFHAMAGVTFLDAQHGWMLASYEVNPKPNGVNSGQFITTVDATTDGGRTWQIQSVLCSRPSVSAPDCVTFQDSAKGADVRDLRFINLQDGWAFGPGLLVTHDGGKTWKKVNVAGSIIAFEKLGETIWALQTQGPCSNYPDTPLQCTRVKLLISQDKGRTWQSQELPSEQVFPSDLEFVLGLALVDSHIGWLLYLDKLMLLSFDNGKVSWKVFEIPSPCTNTLGVYVVPIDRQHLWLACSNNEGGTASAKSVYTSSDGGQTWQLQMEATFPPDPNKVDITSWGYLRHFYAFSMQSAWMTMARGAPIGTDDGGKTWHDLGIIPPNMADETLNERVIWVDRQHVWYYSSSLLLHTTDGGLTWICERANEESVYAVACSAWGSATDPHNATPFR